MLLIFLPNGPVSLLEPLSDLRRRIVGSNTCIRKQSLIFTFRAEFGKSAPLLKYDEPWKQQRKIIAYEFSNSSTISRYWSLQEQQARLLVNSVLKNHKQMRREVSMYVLRLRLFQPALMVYF
jgi:hypothetical protein